MSDFTARREARIRKILENSSTRLKKIATVSDDLTDEQPSASTEELVPLKREKQTFNEPVPETHSNNDDDINVIYQDDEHSYRSSEPAIEIPDSSLLCSSPIICR
ncbi:hypothetical protein RN001_013434 [Aquatica leii]|uniref:Uncharacterized protein n=1 Tax=Aquatica leii TaxID=1421715 RepID=A0AAN7P034_9COLE|nr:hypothetical protein RN001_013434 [Aquatica leii]